MYAVCMYTLHYLTLRFILIHYIHWLSCMIMYVSLDAFVKCWVGPSIWECEHLNFWWLEANHLTRGGLPVLILHDFGSMKSFAPWESKPIYKLSSIYHQRMVQDSCHQGFPVSLFFSLRSSANMYSLHLSAVIFCTALLVSRSSASSGRPWSPDDRHIDASWSSWMACEDFQIGTAWTLSGGCWCLWRLNGALAMWDATSNLEYVNAKETWWFICMTFCPLPPLFQLQTECACRGECWTLVLWHFVVWDPCGKVWWWKWLQNVSGAPLNGHIWSWTWRDYCSNIPTLLRFLSLSLSLPLPPPFSFPPYLLVAWCYLHEQVHVPMSTHTNDHAANMSTPLHTYVESSKHYIAIYNHIYI